MPRLKKSIDATHASDPGMTFNWIGSTCEIAKRGGIDIERLLVPCGIGTAGDGITPETVLRADQFLLMCFLVIDAVGDEMHGATRAPMRLGTASIAVRAMVSSSNLRVGLASLLKVFGFAGSFCRFHFEIDAVRSQIFISIDEANIAQAAVAEEILAHALHIFMSYYVGFFFPVETFVTSSSLHPCLGRRHEYLRCGVAKGATTALVFSTDLLKLGPKTQNHDTPFANANLFWLSLVSQQASNPGWESYDAPFSRQIYRELLNADRPLGDFCEQYGLTDSALRKDLLREGSSFRTIRKTAFMERVIPLIRSGRSAEDVAADLGYSDGRSLRRAVKIAAGLSLNEIRRQDAVLNYPQRTQVRETLRTLALRLDS